MNTWLFFGVAAGTIIITTIIGVVRTRGLSAVQYTSDPSAHPWWAVCLSILGTIVGGGMFLVVGQIGCEAGIAGLLIGAAYLVGLVIFGCLSPALRRALDQHEVNTVVDLLERVYSKRVSASFAVLSLVMYLFLLAAQVWAVVTFTEFACGLSPGSWMPWALVAMAGVAALTYPIIGGLRKDISTDTIQMLIITLGGIVLAVGLFRAGVPARMWSELPRSHLTGMGEPGSSYGMMVIGSVVFVPTLFLVRMDMWQRVAACRPGKGLVAALVVAGIGSAIFYALFTLVGIWGKLDGVQRADRATLEMITSHVTQPEALGLVVGALYAAVLSSADTFINNGSIFAARVIAPAAWRRDLTANGSGNSRLLLVERLTAFGVLGVSVALGFFARDFVDLLAGAFTLLLVYVAPVVSTLFDCRRSEPAAFWSPLAAGAVFLVLFVTWDPKIAAPLCAVLALVAYVALLFMTKHRKEANAA